MTLRLSSQLSTSLDAYAMQASRSAASTEATSWRAAVVTPHRNRDRDFEADKA